jgi:hypothetical protein
MYRILVFVTIILSSCNASKPVAILEKSNFVYHIQPNSDVDDPSFKLCDVSSAYPYYGTETSNSIDKRKLLEHFIALNSSTETTDQSGYIVIRFMVNCAGEPGRYRLSSFDEDYTSEEFPGELTDILLQQTKKIKSWNVVSHGGRKFDSYYYFAFKIENGKLTDVMP